MTSLLHAPTMETWRPEAILRWVSDNLAPARLSSSFAGESVVLMHMIAEVAPDIEVFTVDTGRLPEATHELIDRVRRLYGIRVEVLYPDGDAVAKMVTERGMFSFRNSVDERLECCYIRKVEPVGRGLTGARGWITGLRRDDSDSRAALPIISWDEQYGLTKVNPLATWDTETVWRYIREHDVPYNRLYDQGYTSIGCAPCTRPTAPDEEARAGRWWWESNQNKECGIHRPTN